MKYDFTTFLDRHNQDALAIDALGTGITIPKEPLPGFSVIPMWVADMNFLAYPGITKEIAKRIEHPIFGYFDPSNDYYQAIINWQKRHNNVTGLKKSHIGYENGVLGGLISALRSLAAPGEPILVNSPTYIGFTHALMDNGYKIILSPLVIKNGHYEMDYENMDYLIKKHNIRVGIICNPHNPTGRSWTKEELQNAMEVYKANDCIVISDEIWSDIELFGNVHVPTQSVSKDAKMRTIALYAPSKTFNLAGLIGSYHIIYNEALKELVTKEGLSTHYNSMNVLSMHALIGASTGDEWLAELREVLSENIETMYQYLTTKIEGLELIKPEATYMLFVDCSKYLTKHNLTLDDLLKRAWDHGVIFQDGRPFHGENAIRINVALPNQLLNEAINRLSEYVFID